MGKRAVDEIISRLNRMNKVRSEDISLLIRNVKFPNF